MNIRGLSGAEGQKWFLRMETFMISFALTLPQPVYPSRGKGHSGGNGTWRLADGGRVRFDNYQVKYIYDPYGLRTRIAYNQSGPQAGQRVKVTEPGGRCLWFIYGDQNHGFDQGTEWGDWTPGC